jgi:hypothetical protein
MWEDNIKMDLKEIVWEVVDWTRMKMTVFCDVAPCTMHHVVW